MKPPPPPPLANEDSSGNQSQGNHNGFINVQSQPPNVYVTTQQNKLPSVTQEFVAPQNFNIQN